jgi:hypothetical protein
LALLVACSSPPDITGTYDLRAVNGVALPVRAGWVAQGSSQLTAGSVTLNPDGTYRYRLIFQVVAPGRGEYLDSSVTAGTYDLRMSTVRLHTAGGDMAAQLAGTALALSVGGWNYLFRKAEP